jgi:hypothetical protein
MVARATSIGSSDSSSSFGNVGGRAPAGSMIVPSARIVYVRPFAARRDRHRRRDFSALWLPHLSRAFA